MGAGEEVEAQPSLAQPSLYKLAEPDERLMDHEEAFMFDTLGYLLLRGVMDAEWLSAAREAIAAHETDGVTGDGYTDPTQSEALRGVPGVAQRVYNGGSTVALPERKCSRSLCVFFRSLKDAAAQRIVFRSAR